MAKGWQVHREFVPHEVLDDCGMCFSVEANASGNLTAQVRACGRVMIDGEEYEYDRNFRIRLKKSK
jgi:hypothetical protein